jgi:hypothetical protein
LSPDPFYNRQKEWQLYQPLIGSSMLELGDKVNGDLTYKAFFESKGFRHVSVDTNGNHGALPLDLRYPLKLGTFDMVTNIGTTEHVSPDAWHRQAQCWQNIAEAMHVGSVFVSVTPSPKAWPWHGWWYPTQAFYKAFAAENGMRLQRLYERVPVGPSLFCGQPVPTNLLRMTFCRMERLEESPFYMPDQSLMYRNEPPSAKGYER